METEYQLDYEGYCVKCKEKHQIENGTATRSPKNGSWVAKGRAACGTVVCRILGKNWTPPVEGVKGLLP